jgi:maleylacetate reductase
MNASAPAGTYRYPDMDRVSYGVAFAAALDAERERKRAERVFLIASGTLSRETGFVGEVRAALGNHLAGIWTRVAAHTPRVDVVAAANAAREAGADMLVTLGGGSVTDAAKMVGMCLANDITEPRQLDRLRATTGADGITRRPPTKPGKVRTISIPTTLSAGEFSSFAGCTDTDPSDGVPRKESYASATMIPEAVILDPAATVPTPKWLWLSTGIRAVDHAVEDLCSTNSQPMSDGASLHALRLLSRGLRACKANPADLAARLDCQLGAWMSMVGAQNGVPKGASHGIGHVLGGTAGVPHGYTSCVMLPHVLRFNKSVNAERQAWVAEAMGRPGFDAADVVAALIADLGLPGTLRAVGVRADQLDAISAGAMGDRWVHTNPRKIEGPATVRALLEAAW